MRSNQKRAGLARRTRRAPAPGCQRPPEWSPGAVLHDEGTLPTPEEDLVVEEPPAADRQRCRAPGCRRAWAGVALALLVVGGGNGCRKWPHVEAAAAAAQPVYAPAPRFPATVNRPYGALAVTTDRKDLLGKPARVPCLTCHDWVGAQPGNQQASHVAGFHDGVKLGHGNLTCRSCHRVPGFDGFERADGADVTYAQAMDLCGQCHARRVTEYQNGAHGGMNGSWDLSRGPRTRNHCLDCHNAHAPAVGPVVPAPRHLPRPRT